MRNLSKSERREALHAANLATIEPEYATRCLCNLLRAATPRGVVDLLGVAYETGLRQRMTIVNGTYVPTVDTWNG